ncbi:MAG: DNA alkylation repair protein [Candidatus Scatovivens sp.]
MIGIKEKIKKDLIELSDEKYKKFHSSLCPNTDNILGVRTPILKDYAKNLLKKNPDLNIREVGNEYYEEIMLQGIIIGLKSNLSFEQLKEKIEYFVPKIYNWAICDIFCSSLKITKKYKKEMKQIIKKYLKSSKEFEIRFAIVMILDYYIDEENLEEDFKIFENIKSTDYYVQMAISWALSMCLIKFFDETIEFLKYSNLDTYVYNKALQKGIESYRISENNKKILKNMKKSNK